MKAKADKVIKKDTPKGKGRPTKYNAQFHPALGEALASAGNTNDQIAEKMGVATSTMKLWMTNYHDFSAAIKRGREKPDELVEQSLFRLATGYRHCVQKPMVVSVGNNAGSEVQIVDFEEAIPPNPTAMIFWLKNRRPDKWRDKQEVEQTGNLNINIKREIIDGEVEELGTIRRNDKE